MKNSPTPTIVLAGLESAGKSTLFRGLTRNETGDEANFRGSTIVCRRCALTDCACDLVDTPGIRLAQDSQTTRQALQAAREADAVLLVARGTHAHREVETLLRELDLSEKRSALAITFEDKAPAEIEPLAEHYRQALGIPVVVVNARKLDEQARAEVIEAIKSAAPMTGGLMTVEGACASVREVSPKRTVFERRFLGPLAAVACMAILFALPVYAAYVLAEWAQPLVDAAVITPIKERLAWLPALPHALLLGGYGAITLGWYSFLWAFPVVAFLAVTVALAEETGLKDRVTAALDPAMRQIGLSGRDLIPVLTGFGCNVVAVFQSRACSACTRRACVSLIAFGSACSYQIGASLSVFSSGGHPALFIPYLVCLFAAGAVHTRIWHGALGRTQAQSMHERAFLQWPSRRAVWWRVKTAVRQFLAQAMPIFLLICMVAALLEHAGLLSRLNESLSPVMDWLKLPGEAAGAVVFSILRKDGLLILNTGEGRLVVSMSAGQLFLVVWLASTLTACLVTLWTVRRELGWKSALGIAGRQALTSVVSSCMIAAVVK